MKIPVLYYHEVVPQGQGYTYQKIEESKFVTQMKYIFDNGYRTVTFADIEAGRLPTKPIILTFDDGFRSVYNYAYPILKKYGFNATLFLAPKYIEEEHPYYLSWSMLKELTSNGIADVQGHTYSHVDVRALPQTQLLVEFQNCDKAIEKNLGIIPDVICFPYGVFDRQSLRTLDLYGNYRYYVASYFGRTNFNKKGSKIVQRIGISNDDDMTMFIRKLNGQESYRGIVQYARIIKSSMQHKYEQYRIDF